MKKFMRWLGFVNVYDAAAEYAVPGRAGVSIWDELVAEFGAVPLTDGSWRPAEVMPDWETV